jgi:deoxyadenosine/deoxycytidine kinase
MPETSQLRIGVVGPCGAGKSTLVNALAERGYPARHIAQEHSYVATMWKRMVNPDVLIYLDASYSTSTERRKLDWTQEEYDEQLRRLKTAREQADLIINTDFLTPGEILAKVLAYIENFTRYKR